MTMWPSSTAAATRASGAPTREYRAIVTFAVAAAYVLVALVIAKGTQAAALAALIGLVASLVEARGLSQGSEWARYAMTPMLWIYVVAGLLVFLVVLLHNAINIPLGVILAAWALSARPSESLGPVPAASTAGALLLLSSILAAVIQFF
jgi:hypothetical protein